MSATPVAQLDKNAIAELACTYAALICHDEGLEVNAAQITKLIEASGNKVDSFWPNIFAKALAGKNVGDLLCGGGAAAAAPAQASAAPAAKVEEKKPEPEEEEEEEVDMGDLFGDF